MTKPIEHQSSQPGHLFICYSHQDVVVIEQEAEWLRRQGFKLWYDDHIAAGHAWSEELAEAITNAAAVLYFVSGHSAASAYCMDELHFAKDQQVPVVPIEIEEVNLSPGLQLTLGTKQFIKMHDSSRSAFRSKLAAGLTALLTNRHAQGSGDMAFATVDEGPAGPRILRARLAGLAAAIATLSVISFLSLSD